MSERWPPMIGVVGFDGGYRSAVALALPPEGLIAGEGELLPGEGFGACCYNDGTCDSPITEFDCTSAMGTYQGDGTDCGSVSCVGVCCEPGCVDNTTPDGCELDGGTFQGFGTACADDPPPCPPTGACCDDMGGCTITSEEGCTGTYQGDDTTCDPNPCAMVDCSCGFDAYDGSGRKFLTETRRIVLNTTHDPNSFCPDQPCHGDSEVFTITSIDPVTCEVSHVCSGGGTIDVNADCTSDTCPPLDILGLCQPSSGCQCCETGTGPSCTPLADSATHKFCTNTVGGGDDPCTMMLELEYTLSDECNPI